MSGGKTPPPRLGRGLWALLSEGEAEVAAQTSAGAASALAAQPAARSELPLGTRIPVELVRPNPAQPRRHFDAAELDDLAQSIREKGVLQPLIVRPIPGGPGYEIVTGERRWRAAQMAQLHDVPALVRELSDAEVAQIALIENVQRTDLSAVEEAGAYRQLIEAHGFTQDRLAELIGKSRSHIANTLRLLRLPPEVLVEVAAGRISAGHARALVGAEDPVALARQIVARDLSVRETEKLARRAGGRPAKTGEPRRAPSGDADTRALEGELSASLGMGVRIRHEPGTEGGILSVRYANLDELDLLCQVLAAIPRD
jgi:ParB family chromosome partitioning protein